jgi:NifU-like protein involved in Fe-S cluster formation
LPENIDISTDGLLEVYNEKLIALSGRAATPVYIDAPDLSAKAVSPICGSEVTVQLKVSGDKITAFGFEAEACALARSVIAVMKDAIIGKTRQQVQAAGAALEKLLAGEEPAFDNDWAELLLLTPLKDYKARHNAMMLPFEAVERAFTAAA